MIKLKYVAPLVFLLSLLVYPVFIVRAADPFAEPSLRVGYDAKSFPDFSLEDLEVSIKLLSEELGKEIGIKTTVTVYEDIKAMRDDFEQGKINFVVASAILLATEFDNQLFADGFRFVRSDNSSDQVLVLSQKKYGKTDLKDFRGKRLALTQYDPTPYDRTLYGLSGQENLQTGISKKFQANTPREKSPSVDFKIIF